MHVRRVRFRRQCMTFVIHINCFCHRISFGRRMDLRASSRGNLPSVHLERTKIMRLELVKSGLVALLLGVAGAASATSVPLSDTTAAPGPTVSPGVTGVI